MKTLITSESLIKRKFKINDLDNNIIWWEKDKFILEEIPSLDNKYALRIKINDYDSKFIKIISFWEELKETKTAKNSNV